MARDGLRTDRSGGPWTSFFVSVLFLLVFPLFPLGAELAFTKQINISSLMLTTATYSLSLSVTSTHVGRWAVGITFAFVAATLFGWSMGIGDAVIGPAYRLGQGAMAGEVWLWGAAIIITFVLVTHLWGCLEKSFRSSFEKGDRCRDLKRWFG
jgi:predicted ABC-type exoprotein transport system permease subunit